MQPLNQEEDLPVGAQREPGVAPGAKIARFGLWLAIIALAALGLRVGYVLVAKADGVDACGEDLCGDAIYYSTQAEAIGDGNGWEQPFNRGQPAADHPPLTALVAAPSTWLSGDHVLPERLTMSMIGVASVVVIGLLGRSVAGDRTGLIAAGVAAVYPNLWVNDGLIMSESLVALGVAVSLLLTYRLIRGPTLTAATWLGVAVGMTILARAEMALYLPIVVVPVLLWAHSLNLARRIGRIAVVIGVTVAVLVPWTAYNLSRFDRPVLVSTNDGLTLLGANCDQVYSLEGTGLWSIDCAGATGNDGDQSVQSAAKRRAAFDFIGAHLGRLPKVVAVRIGRVWSLYEPAQMISYTVGEGRERGVSELGLWSYYPLLIAAGAGVVILRRRRTPVWPLAAMAVIVTITAGAFYGLLRFRVPAEVAIVVLAAVSVDAVVRRIARGHATPDPVSAGSGGGGFDQTAPGISDGRRP